MPLSHNDDPTLRDGFDNQGFIKEICSLITRCTPPKGIGLNGYWGTGKTSALLQVCHQLTGQNPYTVVKKKMILSIGKNNDFLN